MTAAKPLSARAVVSEIKVAGIEYVAWLPDTETRFMYDAVMADGSLRLVGVCRESEAYGIAAGLYVGGVRAAVMIQNTGFLESGDALRGMALFLRLPLLIIVGYRGWHRDRPMIDSAGVYTEPILRAWELHYELVESGDDVHRISEAARWAREQRAPAVVLMGREYAQP